MVKSRLTFIEKRINKNNSPMALYECSCGNKKEIRPSFVNSGRVVSCGCYAKEKMFKHGLTSNPLFRTWILIKQRCYNQNNEQYKYYGARGIQMCEEWFNEPKSFVEWGAANGWQKGLEIDRENNDLGYSPENCRWVTPKINSNNRRSNIIVEHEGRKQTVKQWAEELNLNYAMLIGRINKGWDTGKALTMPSYKPGFNKRERERADKRKLKREKQELHARL
jgi:hypothetical protein